MGLMACSLSNDPKRPNVQGSIDNTETNVTQNTSIHILDENEQGPCRGKSELDTLFNCGQCRYPMQKKLETYKDNSFSSH